MASPIIITPSLEGTQNLQTQNVNVIVSGNEDYTVRLGIPPASANPNVTIVSFGAGNRSVEFVNGALGYGSKGDVLSGNFDFTGKRAILQTKYVGGYWLFI